MRGGLGAHLSSCMAMAGIESRVRAICLALPGVTERSSHGAPAFFAGRQFVMLWPRGHHERRFPHMWCAAPEGAQEALVGGEPARYFRPPYVGARGWLGVRLDRDVDWGEVAELCEDGFRTVAPAKLAAILRGQGHGEALADPAARRRRSGRWTSFVAESPETRGLHEQGNPLHRLRVEHDGRTLFIHLSDEDGKGWTTVAVDRESRRFAVAQGRRQSDTARLSYTELDRLRP